VGTLIEVGSDQGITRVFRGGTIGKGRKTVGKRYGLQPGGVRERWVLGKGQLGSYQKRVHISFIRVSRVFPAGSI
jgi:hypothetical protein